ncbi:MAG: hypothetical protein KGJ84_12590 [Elusimicrobia bacterium]|nr:hypothetical protein [Elusimicrobiota bacterium]
MKTLARIFAAAVFAVSMAHADGGGTKLSQAASDPLGSAILPVAGMHDMTGRRWGVAVSPFAWKTDNILSDGSCCTNGGGAVGGNGSLPSVSGYGGSAAIQYEFSSHWGAQAFFGMARGGTVDLGAEVSGLAPTTAFTGSTNGAGFAGGNFSGMDGTVVGAMATWDPYDNPKGFRMPISLGVFEGWQQFNFNHTFVNPNNATISQDESVKFRRSYPGVVGGISFDFLLFKELRVMPGILVGQGFAGQEAGYDYVVVQNGVSRSFHHTLTGTPGFGAVYLATNYRPWGIGYTVTFIPNFASTHAITWTHHWGPGAAASR